MTAETPGLIGGPLCGRTLEKVDESAEDCPPRITLPNVGTYTRMDEIPLWMSAHEPRDGFRTYLWSELSGAT